MARASARRAYGRAKAAAAVSLLADRFWSETLLAAEGQPAARACEMFRRTEHLLVLLRDRADWAR